MAVPVNMVEICIAESWTGTVSRVDQHYIYILASGQCMPSGH